MLLKDKKILYTLIESAVIALIPTLISPIIQSLIQGDTLPELKTLFVNNLFILFIISFSISFIFILILLELVQKLPFFRAYRQYEGKWVEYLRDKPEAPIAVCTLHYSRGEYHFDGTNFSDQHDEIVRFKSVKFMGDGDDGFYYVTQGNQTYFIRGFGSIFSLSKGSEGFYEGNGFFFDVSDINETLVRHMELFKFDKKFWKQHLKLTRSQKPKKFSDREIYDYTKEYVKKVYYKNQKSSRVIPHRIHWINLI